jgi:hypothetical protein
LVRTQFGIPEIFENEATGNINFLYQDIKFVLKVPVVNFVFRTLAYYDQFLRIGWSQVRANMLTINMEEAAKVLRYPTTSFKAPNIEWEKYYQKETIDTIRKIIFTFNYVNTKLLLITTAWEESLGYRPILGGKVNNGFIQPGIITDLPSFQLINIPVAPSSIQHLLMDIMNKKKGYDVASDYRALACFPTFLEITWTHMRNYIGTNDYTLLSKNIKENARKIVHQHMPYPVTITPEALYSFYSPRDIAGIMGIISMFSNFIADLVIDGQFFRSFL